MLLAEAGDDCGDESVDEKVDEDDDDDDELHGVELPDPFRAASAAAAAAAVDDEDEFVLMALKVVRSCSMLFISPKIHTESSAGWFVDPAPGAVAAILLLLLLLLLQALIDMLPLDSRREACCG